MVAVTSSNREETLRARNEERAHARADAKAQTETHAAATKAQADVNAQLVGQLLTLAGDMERYKSGRDSVANIVGTENGAKDRTVEREKSESGSGSEYESELDCEYDSDAETSDMWTVPQL